MVDNHLVVICRDEYEYKFEFDIKEDGRVLSFNHSDYSDDEMAGSMGNDYMTLTLKDPKAQPVWVVAWEGRLYDEKSSYPIELHLTIDNNEADSEAVSGYYFYKKKGSANRIPLTGEVERPFSSMSTFF